MWTSWETRCGIASYTAALIEELRGLQVDVDVVDVPYTDRDVSRMEARLARLNAADLVHVQHEYTFWGGVAPRSSSLAAYYRKLRAPRVVTAHTVFSAAELLRLAVEHRPRQRIAKQILTALPSYRRYVERAPFVGAHTIIVHTEEARSKLLSRGFPAEKVTVLPAGIPRAQESTPEGRVAFRERLGPEGTRLLTIFGFVNPDKGYEVALEALGKLPPQVRLVIAGGTRVEQEQAYMEELRETIRTRGLEKRVSITGYLEEREIADVMALTELVLVPHTAANGSYSVMVALSYGKPVLASDLACFREVREQGGGVELFERGDESMLAERIGFLLASSGARKQLAAAAAAYAKERSWASVAERTRDIYTRVLAGK